MRGGRRRGGGERSVVARRRAPRLQVVISLMRAPPDDHHYEGVSIWPAGRAARRHVTPQVTAHATVLETRDNTPRCWSARRCAFLQGNIINSSRLTCLAPAEKREPCFTVEYNTPAMLVRNQKENRFTVFFFPPKYISQHCDVYLG